MLIEHPGHKPVVPDSAYVAPSATLCGAAVLGEGTRVLHGAVLTSEDGEVRVGENTVMMEHALVRGRFAHPALIGDAVMIGPHAHVNGAVLRDEVFIATGASLFPGAVVEAGGEVRINAPPERHEGIWAVQRELDFPGTVYGVDRGTSMHEIMAAQSEFYGSHRQDTVLGHEGM